jgi:hypothetical protein
MHPFAGEQPADGFDWAAVVAANESSVNFSSPEGEKEMQ